MSSVKHLSEFIPASYQTKKGRLCLKMQRKGFSKLSSPKIVEGLLCVLLTASVFTMGKVQCKAVEPLQMVDTELKPATAVKEIKAVYNVPLDHELQLFIIQICEEHHIDPAIVIAMIDEESEFDSDAIGDSGAAFGLMQVQPKWHRERMDRLGVTDLLDPYQNVTVGIDYFAELLALNRGIEWALMCYNGGFPYANAKSANGVVSSYVKDVLGSIEKLTEGMIQIVYP